MATTSLSKGSFPVLLLVAALPAISAGVQGYYRPVIGPGLGVLEKIDSPCLSHMRCYVTPPIVYGYVYVPAPRVYGPALYGRRPYAPGAYAPRPYPVRPNPYARYYGFPQTLRRYYRRPPAGAAPPDGPPPASASAPKTAAGHAGAAAHGYARGPGDSASCVHDPRCTGPDSRSAPEPSTDAGPKRGRTGGQ